MSIRRQRPPRVRVEPARHLDIEGDLRERGIAEELHAAFVERLAPVSQGGSPEAYRAALDAVVLAYRNAAPLAPAAPTSFNELQLLMEGFAGELRKLEEAMRTLDAYVTRMRSQTDVPAGRLQ